MTAITEHRNVGFSISTISEGRWRWTLHPAKPTPVGGIVGYAIKSGEVFGTYEDATVAAKAAIDALLEGKNPD